MTEGDDGYADRQVPHGVLEARTVDGSVADFDDDLWLDRVARWFGMGWLSRRLPGDLPPSYLYAFVLVGTIEPVLNVPAYVAGQTVPYIENPFFVLQPLALIGGVVGARSLRRRYHRVAAEMQIPSRLNDTQEVDALVKIVPTWLPWTLFAIGAGVSLLRLAALGGVTAVYHSDGLAPTIGYLVVNPFVWSPIAAQFIAVYVSIMIVAPWRLWRSELGIDFLDPEGLGGLRPIGELVKHSYYYIVVGLIAYAFVLYGPVLVSADVTRTEVTGAIFTATWLLSVASVAIAVYILHRFMYREKRAELRRLDAALRDCIENPWDISRYDVTPDNQDTVDEIRRRMELVSATNEYPATFSIWSQILVSIVAPKLVQLTMASI